MALAPPRFDTFSERLVGSWQKQQQFVAHLSDSSSPTQQQIEESKKHVVDEVMRRCGGAVQGIQEGSDSDEESSSFAKSFYLNRADDGFVYYNDGYYSQGPVTLKSLSFRVVSNLMLPHRQRLLLSSEFVGPSSDDDDDHSNKNQLQCQSTSAMLLVRGTPPGGEDDEQQQLRYVRFLEQEPSIDWLEETTCSMASPTPPWLLPRAKWEQTTTAKSDDGEKEEAPAALLNDNDTVCCWTTCSMEDGDIITISVGAAAAKTGDDDARQQQQPVTAATCQSRRYKTIISSSDDGTSSITGLSLVSVHRHTGVVVSPLFHN